MSGIKTLEELQADLADAQLAFERHNAALQGLGPDSNKETRDDLESKFSEKEAEVAKLAGDIARIERMNKALNDVPRAEVKVGEEPRTYAKGVREADGTARSFFGDLFRKHMGDIAAETRLARHAREVASEKRGAITTGTGGPGLVPPQYLLDELAQFARSSRPFADALGPRALPETGMTFNVPRVTTGTVTAVQATETTTIQDGSAVTDYLAFTVNTVAGKQIVSRQLLERSDPATDTVIGQDLAADYAKQLDTQLLTQATNGITVLSGTNSVTYTQATPTAATLYPKIADAVQQIWTNRFAAPSLIVMAPRRWGSLIGAVDTSGRPLVVPDAPAAQSAWNAMSIGDATIPAGLVGLIQGLPVVVDANIPVNLGVSTDQDTIIVTRREDQLLFEVGAPTVTVDMSSLSDNLNVKIYAYGYFAFTFARYVKGTSIIGGTGLKTPTF